MEQDNTNQVESTDNTNQINDSQTVTIDGQPEVKKKKFAPPYVFLSVAFLIIAVLGLSYFLIKRWEGSSEFYIDTSIDTETETDDHVTLLPPDLFREDDDGITTIVIFGNDTFCDTTNGPSIVKLLQENSTATIYDCTFPGSTMCTATEYGPGESGHPEDWFCLYWLWERAKSGDLSDQRKALYSVPGVDTKLYEEHLNTLESIDFNKVDYILLCYDASDYYKGHPFLTIGNEFNPMCINGVLYGVQEKMRGNYPGMQIAVVSPTYCYALDKLGNKKGANFVRINDQTLADVILFMKTICGEYAISYVDDYFGVKINEETADLYLTDDNMIPNLAGKKLIAAHILNKAIRRVEVKKTIGITK